MCYSILYSNLLQKMASLNPEGPLGLCDVILPAILIMCQFPFCGTKKVNRMFKQVKKSNLSFFSSVCFLISWYSYDPLLFISQMILSLSFN